MRHGWLFVAVCPIVGIGAPVCAAETILIDDFTVGEHVVAVDGPVGAGVATPQLGLPTDHVFGGDRLVWALVRDFTGVEGTVTTGVTPLTGSTGGYATFETPGDTGGWLRVHYGRLFDNPLNYDFSTIQGFEVDLLASDSDEASFAISFQGLTATGSGGNGGLMGRATFTTGITGTVFIPVEFTGSLDPTNVDELWFIVGDAATFSGGVSGANFRINEVRVVVPEPATAVALMTPCLAAFAARSRRS